MAVARARTVVSNFPAGFSGLSGPELTNFSKKHGLAQSDDLLSALTGVAISAHTGRLFSSVRVSRRDAIRHLQAIENTTAKLERLLDENMLLAYSLMFDIEEAPIRGRELRGQLIPALQTLRDQLQISLPRLRKGQFRCPYVHNKRGRPKAEKHEWLRELWRFFLARSSKKTILNFNPKANSAKAKRYSGGFFLFCKDFCRIAEVQISDDELAKSIRRIIQNKK